ncbi:AraC-type DNA-binding protein [Chitinophaga sp. CF118]|uniref:AraC family transcriptional regulator n=1 Tax=Chitinophaga sp. CF118 TaxID=1884367 RepID=UPI0008DF9E95|nr:helix-turn-helix transcriptional regulator [Chitinophaga sp. CF118]SFE02127.1 AraC-type DNA-binding protein [Chitinophaga sp. CF118]
MARATIPVYDICTIDKNGPAQDLMIERFGGYLEKHYQALHHAHRHSFYHLVLFTQGSGTHTIDFVKFDVRPYQIYFMAPGQVHSWDFRGNTDGYIIHFSADFFRPFLLNPSYLEQFSFFSGISGQCVCQLTKDIREEIVRIFEALLKEQNKDMIRLRLLEMFITVEKHTTHNEHNHLPQHTTTLLKSFQQLINQYYRTMRLPKEYAELLYITPNHLNALCRELLGKTAGDVIRERVLLEAKRLLTNAGMSVLEIAYELSFKDNSYFTRFFKNYEGITPEEFRKKFIHL